jgi:hypothetical protein
MKLWASVMVTVVVSSIMAIPAAAQEDEKAAELAKKLANPISSLISVPIQANYDEGIGPDGDGSMWRINVQPVIPFSLNEEWNLITRTIVPIIDQQDVPLRGMSDSGLGDITASQFFSPKAPTAGGWIWGAGPVWLLPSATEDALGSEKFGMGPTFVALKQAGSWTYGALFNHIWSVAGDDDRDDISATFMQPFLSYITKTKTTLSLSVESTYDWEAEEWSIPINFGAYQLLKMGKLPVQLGGGVRYWADSPDYGPEGWGARLQFTFLFPK